MVDRWNIRSTLRLRTLRFSISTNGSIEFVPWFFFIFHISYFIFHISFFIFHFSFYIFIFHFHFPFFFFLFIFLREDLQRSYRGSSSHRKCRSTIKRTNFGQPLE